MAKGARHRKKQITQVIPREPAKPKRVQNMQGRYSGMGSQFDYGMQQQPNTQYLTPFMQDRYAVDLYYTDWAAKKVIQIPVEDMLRLGWRYGGIDDAFIKVLETTTDHLDVLEHFKTAMRLERLIGGAVMLMGIEDGAPDASYPVNYEALQQGCLKFLNVVPRTRVTKTELNNDPLQANFGRPEHYWMNGQRIHCSRLILFKGDPLLQTPDPTIMPTQWMRNDGFGISVLMPILDDLQRATGSRQAAYQLVQRASVFLYQTDTLDLEGTKDGQESLKIMQDIINQINLFRGAVVNRQPGQADPITTISPQFGSVPELVMSFIQILSAASDIPATRFIGQAPGGLNATGESDLENYYGRLESLQKQELRPKLLKLCRVMGISALGSAYDRNNLEVEFDPLWSLSALEQSQVRTADITNVIAMITNNLITDIEALEELKLRDALRIDVDKAQEQLEIRQDDEPTKPLADTLKELTDDVPTL